MQVYTDFLLTMFLKNLLLFTDHSNIIYIRSLILNKKEYDIMKNLRSYLLDDEELLMEVVREINKYNNSLKYLAYYENDEYTINELFPIAHDFAKKCIDGNYSYYDDYFIINNLGYIISYDWNELVSEVKKHIDDIIKELKNNYLNIDVYDVNLNELLN